ncbi:hypothetical protein BCT86_01985 [Vibrio breoganii]|nr:hypothetical protein BCT86_01985 [Vibrio breoganii]
MGYSVKVLARVILERFSGPAHWSGVCFCEMQLNRSPIKHFGDDECTKPTQTHGSFPNAFLGQHTGRESVLNKPKKVTLLTEGGLLIIER